MSGELSIKGEKADSTTRMGIKPDPDSSEFQPIEHESRNDLASSSVDPSGGLTNGGTQAVDPPLPTESRAKLEFCIQLVTNAIKYMQAEDCGLYIRRSYYHMKLGDLESAKADGLKAVELGPASPAARGQLASVYVEMKKIPEAEKILTEDLPKGLTDNSKSYDQLKQITFRLRRETLIKRFNIPADSAEDLAKLPLLEAIKRYTDS